MNHQRLRDVMKIPDFLRLELHYILRISTGTHPVAHWGITIPQFTFTNQEMYYWVVEMLAYFV